MEQRIFLLAIKKSKKRVGTTYVRGDEVSYVYNADYTENLQNALDWLNNTK